MNRACSLEYKTEKILSEEFAAKYRNGRSPSIPMTAFLVFFKAKKSSISTSTIHLLLVRPRRGHPSEAARQGEALGGQVD